MLYQAHLVTRLLKNIQSKHHTQTRSQGPEKEAPCPRSERGEGEIRPASHLTKVRVGTNSDGDGVDHQQQGQQQLEGGMSEQVLDAQCSDVLLHIPGILEGDGDLPSAGVTTGGLHLDSLLPVPCEWGERDTRGTALEGDAVA